MCWSIQPGASTPTDRARLSSTPIGPAARLLVRTRMHDTRTHRAAEHGAAIIDIRTFAPDEVSSRSDLTEADEVVAALSQAIRTRGDV